MTMIWVRVCYLVDTMNDQVSVPMTETEYNAMYEELDIAEELEWIPTKPTQEDAVYPDEEYN